MAIVVRSRASPDEARLRISFEGELSKAKLAVAPRRSYGERSRGARIRTWDPLVPNQVHYRTVLHPELIVDDPLSHLPKRDAKI
jgi:hypothetical protein